MRTLGKLSYCSWYMTERMPLWVPELPEGRTLVKGGGFACALVKASVFTILQDPWFQYVINENGSTLSEDYYFCRNARFMGLDIYMDPRVRCGHLARYYQYE